MCGAIALVAMICAEAEAEACVPVSSSEQFDEASTSNAAPGTSTAMLGEAATAPQIVRSGFRAPPQAHEKGTTETTHLWLQLAEVPPDAHFVVLEPVWGIGPRALSAMWGKALPIHSRHVFVYPSWRGPHRDQAFTLGYRLRFVFDDGSLSSPSLPTFVTHSGTTASSDNPRSHQVLVVLCCLALFGLWIVYRRDSDPVHRIRVAAAVGLVSVLFLATAPALSWLTVEDPSGRLAAVDCHLGDETQCATYVPDAGPNPMSSDVSAADRQFEVARWSSASSALRLGLILCLVLLMPALIWLLVAPTLRIAQSTTVFGASAAGYTLLASLCYRLTVPSWMVAESGRALEMTIITTANIVVAAGLVVFWSFRHLSEEQSPLPTARARIR